MIPTLLLTATVLVVTIVLAIPLGAYMHRVYAGERFWASRLLGPVERLTYRLIGTSPEREMDWKRYALAILLFNLAGGLFLYILLLLQGHLPLTPCIFPVLHRVLPSIPQSVLSPIPTGRIIPAAPP
jgi:K+-transporting ATPase, A chain